MQLSILQQPNTHIKNWKQSDRLQQYLSYTERKT